MDLNDIMRLVAFENGVDPVAVEEHMVSRNDTFITSGANDIIYGGTGDDYFDGGDGTDTVVYRESRGRDITVNTDDSVTVTNGSETDHLVNIERIQFNDGTLSFDAAGNTGQAYRIYQAAFDRTPDTEGLSYWIDRLDSGDREQFRVRRSTLHPHLGSRLRRRWFQLLG